MRLKHTEKWYARRLTAYFMDHYGDFEDVVEWWEDPNINTWLFDIRETGTRIELVCKENGTIEETTYPLAH